MEKIVPFSRGCKSIQESLEASVALQCEKTTATFTAVGQATEVPVVCDIVTRLKRLGLSQIKDAEVFPKRCLEFLKKLLKSCSKIQKVARKLFQKDPKRCF